MKEATEQQSTLESLAPGEKGIISGWAMRRDP